jgi:hypothetical protein
MKMIKMIKIENVDAIIMCIITAAMDDKFTKMRKELKDTQAKDVIITLQFTYIDDETYGGLHAYGKETRAECKLVMSHRIAMNFNDTLVSWCIGFVRAVTKNYRDALSIFIAK